MTVIRLVLLVAALGVITLLLAQNWSPAIPLVFLGLRTQPLSLAIWMLLSAAAGACSSLLISSLLQLSSRNVRQQRQTPSYSPNDSPPINKRTPREKESYQRNSTPPATKPQPPDEFRDTYNDDWDLDENVNDDWEFSEREYQANASRNQYTKIQDDRDYEDIREPENDNQSADSSYSYNKRDLKKYDIGNTESVYDADYRVIIPPPNSSTTPNTSDDSDDNNDNDDWGFLNEDFDDDKPSSRQ